jgi:hypothetical protein
MSIEYRVGDVRDRLAEIPDGSIDLVVSSPPFLALRSYLPADHPDKHREIGSEPTPAEFIDTLLALTAEFDRVLAPHGSICIELGDTFSGSGGAGGDYNAGGLRDGQGKSDGSARRANTDRYRGYSGGREHSTDDGAGTRVVNAGGNGWPLAKSLTGIPTLYTWSLAYGRNLLTGEPSPAGQWRIRNVIVWARPNPPVGALGDKFRPATSYITVACKSAKRYFDLDAVRTDYLHPGHPQVGKQTSYRPGMSGEGYGDDGRGTGRIRTEHPAGAPPLDWHADEHPEDGDWLWKLSTQPYAGSHYATFPLTLPKRLIEAMCPQRVCVTCGAPSVRIVEQPPELKEHAAKAKLARIRAGRTTWTNNDNGANSDKDVIPDQGYRGPTTVTLGWTECGHDTWRTGVVLDPFAGSGTTLEAAQIVGRHGIGIDLDARNADLARERVGMFLDVVEGAA